MADDKKKKISLGGIDNAAEEKGSFMKTLWQLVKFLVVSGLVTIIQLALAALLPLVCDQIHTLLPEFLRGIFTPTMFSTGSAEASKYVIDGVVTWGYVLPFLLSNLIANIYGFYQNKKTTFKSDSPWYNFVIYIVLLLALILFSTWMQGAIVGAMLKLEPSNWFFKIITNESVARLIASMCAGFVQMVVLFPMEKFVLMPEKKKDGEEAAEAAAE
jgi:putative flippase GtrA